MDDAVIPHDISKLVCFHLPIFSGVRREPGGSYSQGLYNLAHYPVISPRIKGILDQETHGVLCYSFFLKTSDVQITVILRNMDDCPVMSVPGSNRKGKHAAFSSMGMGMVCLIDLICDITGVS